MKRIKFLTNLKKKFYDIDQSQVTLVVVPISHSDIHWIRFISIVMFQLINQTTVFPKRCYISSQSELKHSIFEPFFYRKKKTFEKLNNPTLFQLAEQELNLCFEQCFFREFGEKNQFIVSLF
eukprot:TRINITY_DN961_c1_g1_i1.p1 TRINITY_DN961_c1_g1~~TRINITY_DN961_c1_g1_i1.p1  ORF type:complete len:122 (-),score=0.09 TRINITY_DN961_c1_g1_i1:549-914(-)